MTTPTEAMRQALEALEQLQGLCSEEPGFVEQVTIWTPEAITALRTALDAQERATAPVVPAGWRLVPADPTLDMGWAYLNAANESSPEREHSFNHAGYRAMLAAAPAAPVVREREAGWWSLVMNAASAIEDAANCLRDPDAKSAAEGAAKHYRQAAQAMWSEITADATQAAPVVPQPAAQQGEAVAPVAYRYKGSRGHWRYVGYPFTPGWDMPQWLKHEPLYTAPPARQAVAPEAPAAAMPYEPTEEMRWAAKRIDPAMTHEQIRALWSVMWSAAPKSAARQAVALTDADIRRLMMAHGFTIKEGLADLKPYVYEAARAIERAVWQANGITPAGGEG